MGFRIRWPSFLLAAVLSGALLGCGEIDTTTVKSQDGKTSGDCPLPNLATEDKKSVGKFGIEVGKIANVTGSGKVELERTLKRSYPDDADVRRIYALTYAACVACRLTPTETARCAELFRQIIAENVSRPRPFDSDADLAKFRAADRYTDDVMALIRR